MNTNSLIDAIGQMDDRYVLEAEKTYGNKCRLAVRRWIAVAAAAVLCLLLGIPALAAADVEPAYELLYSVSPGAAQKLKPVRMACEDNGIVMEVCSAAASGPEAFILITMRDEAGQRVDNTIDLFDSYSINRPFDSSATCERLAYDETTNTALFQIQITQMDGRKITGGKVTFGVGCFLSAKRECDVELRELAVSAEKPALMAHPELRGGAGESEAPVAVLQPNDNAYSPTQGVWITAAGFVDGKLHVQAYYEDILHTDNHGYIYLLDKNGNTVNASAGVSVWDEAHSGSYEEYVFDVGPEALSAYTICGSFTTAGRLTTGNWQVTFPLHIEAS